jgi:2OG-Fe(II) oxygenase superfamily
MKILRARFLSFFATLAVVVAASSEPEAKDDTPPRTSLHRHFQSSYSDVYVIPNFLPMELALEWRRRMLEAWQDTQALLDCSSATQSGTCPNKDLANAFHYATNNAGTFQGIATNNAKVRSLDKIPQRNQTAHQMYAGEAFAYAKWELPPSHELVQEMETYFGRPSTREKVQQLLAKEHPDLQLQAQLADLFVTYYGPGDFLSPHNDGVAGTWAFVLSLAQQPDVWTTDMGGTLQFACPHFDKRNFNDPNYWCEELVPSFNTALLFNTRLPSRRMGPYHRVLPVKVGPASGFFRFGLTGWYMDAKDIMSDNHKAELVKMRSRG